MPNELRFDDLDLREEPSRVSTVELESVTRLCSAASSFCTQTGYCSVTCC
jgi:hypothetical protein